MTATAGNWVERHTGIVTGVCAAPSLAINVYYQLSQPRDGAMSHVMVAAAALSVIVACAATFALRNSLKSREFGIAVICLLALLATTAFNLSNAVGFAGESRSEIGGTRTSREAVVKRLRDEDLPKAKQSGEAPAAKAAGKTPAMAEADLKALELDQKWSKSGKCEDAEKIAKANAVSLCKDHAGKRAILIAAKAVETIDEKIAELNRQIEENGGAGVVGQPADTQAASIAHAASLVHVTVSEKEVGDYLNFGLGVVIEILGTFGPLIMRVAASSSAPIPVPAPRPTAEVVEPIMQETPQPVERPAEMAAPVASDRGAVTAFPLKKIPKNRSATDRARPIVEDFCKASLMRKPGAQIQAVDLYEAFKAWLEQHKLENITQAAFGRVMAELGYQKDTPSTNRTFYRGVALKGMRLAVVNAGMAHPLRDAA